jgi:hypothetical protein
VLESAAAGLIGRGHQMDQTRGLRHPEAAVLGFLIGRADELTEHVNSAFGRP